VRWLLILRPPALGGWQLLLLLGSAALDGCLLLPLLRLTARGGFQLLLLASRCLLQLIGSPALYSRLRSLCC
jgi:hypothetical protein